MTAASPPGAHELRLKVPVVFASKTYEALNLRPPTVGEMREVLGQSDFAAARILAHKIALVLPGVLEKMGARDARAVERYFVQSAAFAPPPADETPWTLKLTAPITHGDGTVWELALREPQWPDLEAAELETGFDATQVLIARLTGIERPVLEKMSISDFRRAAAYFEGFR